MGINPDAFFLRALERWDTESQQRHKTGRPVTEASARQRLKMPLFHEIVVRQARPAISWRWPASGGTAAMISSASAEIM